MFSELLHVDNALAKDTEIRRLGSNGRCEWLSRRGIDCLDLCGRLGFNLERMQTRGELLCQSGVDESVALHGGLRFRRREKIPRERATDRPTRR